MAIEQPSPMNGLPASWALCALENLNRFGFYALGVCKGRDVRQRRPTTGWRMDVVGYLAVLNFLELLAGAQVYSSDESFGICGLEIKAAYCVLVFTLYSQSLWRSKLDIKTGDKIMAAMLIASGLCSIVMFCGAMDNIQTYRFGLAGISLIATLALCMLPGFGRGGLAATLSVTWVLVSLFAVCGLIVHTECRRSEILLFVVGLVFYANLICTSKHVIFINKEDFTRLVTGHVTEREDARPGPRSARHSGHWGEPSGLLPLDPGVGAAVLELRSLRASLEGAAPAEAQARVDRIISRLETPSRTGDRTMPSRFNRFDWLAQNPAVPRHVVRFLTLEMAGGRELLSRELIMRQRGFRTGPRDGTSSTDRTPRPSDGILNSSILHSRQPSGDLGMRARLSSPVSAQHFTIDESPVRMRASTSEDDAEDDEGVVDGDNVRVHESDDEDEEEEEVEEQQVNVAEEGHEQEDDKEEEEEEHEDDGDADAEEEDETQATMHAPPPKHQHQHQQHQYGSPRTSDVTRHTKRGSDMQDHGDHLSVNGQGLRGHTFDHLHCLKSADHGPEPSVRIEPRGDRSFSTGSEILADSKQGESEGEGEGVENDGVLRRHKSEYVFTGKRETHSRASSEHSSFFEGKRDSGSGSADVSEKREGDTEDDILSRPSYCMSHSGSSSTTDSTGSNEGETMVALQHQSLCQPAISSSSSTSNNNNNNNNNKVVYVYGATATDDASGPSGNFGNETAVVSPQKPRVDGVLKSSHLPSFPQAGARGAAITTGAPGGVLASNGTCGAIYASGGSLLSPALASRGSDLFVDKNGRFRFSTMLRWGVEPTSSRYMRKQMTRWDFGHGGLFARLEDPQMPKCFAAQPLTTTFIEAMRHFGCSSDLGFDHMDTQLKMVRFMDAIERKYQPRHIVAYHNSLHATDVLQSCVALLNVEEIRQSVLDQVLSTFAVLFSAAIHDVAHPGRNQSFLVQTQSHLSILYSDRSVLEQHHLAVAFDTLRRPEFNFVADLSNADWVLFRERVIQMVLGTDLAMHMEHTGILKDLVESSRPLARAGPLDANLLKTLDENEQSALNTDLNTILCSIVHVSDVGNTAKPWLIYRQWITLVFQEFFDQGDEERTLGLEVAKGYDRNVCFPCEMQTYFFDYIVQDFVDTLAVWSPALGDMLLPNLEANRIQLKAHSNLRIQDFWPASEPVALQRASSVSSITP
ncbi:cAMP-specific 3',5'-cyclic phosphodiesterase [Hondaea fermentalgiana]|uniref:Phosphodiesterase n=1 Tax=Hondaea fermentalgiana TaxID=2315210 RepID=A0A2R5GM01_9STRA|nr:cAMP-specific 3',5'-cyclic phosphodiesterase [Hondaea fermentalgiana]|eukprot:GBG31910.1 cAMP-specific 3',5'-cyclic phosphodiesterase [Hondaea fermentalgiana]